MPAVVSIGTQCDDVTVVFVRAKFARSDPPGCSTDHFVIVKSQNGDHINR